MRVLFTVSKGSQVFSKQTRPWMKQLCKQYDRCLWLPSVPAAQWPLSRHDCLLCTLLSLLLVRENNQDLQRKVNTPVENAARSIIQFITIINHSILWCNIASCRSVRCRYKGIFFFYGTVTRHGRKRTGVINNVISCIFLNAYISHVPAWSLFYGSSRQADTVQCLSKGQTCSFLAFQSKLTMQLKTWMHLCFIAAAAVLSQGIRVQVKTDTLQQDSKLKPLEDTGTDVKFREWYTSCLPGRAHDDQRKTSNS